MAMSYNTLVAPKGTAGSIAGWTGYGKLEGQADTILTEAQSLVFQALRVREMRTEIAFGVPVNNSRVALPARFLDPIGSLRDTTFGNRYAHKDESYVKDKRFFEQVAGGTLGTDPFQTWALVGTPNVNVFNVPNNGLTQGSDITFPNAPVVDGINMTGTFPIIAIIDANNFSVASTNDVSIVGQVSGGGVGVTWSANKLIAGSPSCWAIFDECLQFDQAFDTATQFRLMCFRSPLPLSATNQTNFLTNRYPLILRKACQAAAADFMKDDSEYTKATNALAALIQATNAESDLMYRGAEIDTETP
jgi:hypothetical protein